MSADDIERALDSGPFATWAQPLAALAAAVAEAKPARVVSPAEFLRRCVDGGARCVDVRSPAEFARDAVPGAHSAPLFDDAERADVGKCYAKKGRDEAMRLGLAKLRKKGGLGALAERVAGEAKIVGVYCWRGGLRSGSVAWLLARRNVDVFVLDGGYRAYRRHLRELFEQGPRVIIVGGRTGVGKTRVLRALAAKNHQVLDLEALAAHRGLAFGDLKGRGAAVERGLRDGVRLGLAHARREARRLRRGRGGPRRPVPRAPGALRAHAGGAARRPRRRVGRRARGAPPGGLRRGRSRGRGRRTRLNAALALVAKRLGPDDTAREKRSLDAGNIVRAPAARQALRPAPRPPRRRGARRRAANPSDADAVDAVVVTLSRADTACLPPPPPVM